MPRVAADPRGAVLTVISIDLFPSLPLTAILLGGMTSTEEEDMPDYIAYFNGEWIPYSQVKIDPLDRGFYVGDVVFDVERTFDGKSFRMKQHVDRLYRSLKYVRIDPGLSADEMVEVSEETIRRNEGFRDEAGDFTIHQFVTRGVGRSSYNAGPPTVGVRVNPIDFGRYARHYAGGAHGVITRTQSYPPGCARPQGQALQPHEFQPRRAGGQQRRTRSLRHPQGRGWKYHRGHRL